MDESNPTMDESNPNNNNSQLPKPSSEETLNASGASLREKLQIIRARSRASAKPLRSSNSASATPSSAGDIEPTLPSPTPASTLSVRVEKEPHTHTTLAEPLVQHHNDAPAAFVAPQELHLSNITTQEPVEPDEQTAIGLDETAHRIGVELGPSEFAIPLPMDARIKDDYETTVGEFSTSIRKFFVEGNRGNKEIEDNSAVSDVNQMINRLNNITTHPDLNFPDRAAGEETDIPGEASWAEYSSSKFQLLGQLIEAASNENLHIIIFAREGRTVRIVEEYLLGKGFIYLQSPSEVASDVELRLSRGLLTFAIRPTNGEVKKSSQKPSLIIALDNSFDANSASVRGLRTMWAHDESMIPVIRLIISNSVEHIDLCLPEPLEHSRFRRLVHYTVALRGSVGELQDDALGVQETADQVISCLSSGNFQENWALPPLEILDLDGFEEATTEMEAEESIPEPDQLRSSAPSRQKRWRDGEEQDDSTPAKKQRTTPLEGLPGVGGSTSVDDGDLEESLKTAQRKISQMQKEHTAELGALQSSLADVQAIYEQTESALSKLQHRYESRTDELHKTRRERDQAVEASARSEQRLQRQLDEISKLKEERTALNADLKDARDVVKSGGGTAGELESAREEIRTLKISNASLEKTAHYEKSQSEYTRQQYQNASTAAAQSGMEVRQLREENEQLKRKVASEARKLKELKLKNDGEKHLAKIEELNLALASREKLLKKREEDLRDAMKNRPFRRGSSTTPRSFSRPNSPGAMNGANRGSALRSISEAAQ